MAGLDDDGELVDLELVGLLQLMGVVAHQVVEIELVVQLFLQQELLHFLTHDLAGVYRAKGAESELVLLQELVDLSRPLLYQIPPDLEAFLIVEFENGFLVLGVHHPEGVVGLGH